MPTIAKSYSLTSVRGLSAAEVAKLKRAGVDNTSELLGATQTHYAEQSLAKKSGITLTRMREAVNRADLLQVSGIGPATADLFENVGVNSAKELATRRPDTLWKAIEAYVKARPELNYRLPSPTTVQSLVGQAKSFVAGGAAPVASVNDSVQKAAVAGEKSLHAYVDDVLFSSHPDGAYFRESILAWRPSTEWDQVRARMHNDVKAFFNTPSSNGGAGFESREADGNGFMFVGRILGLYTEVHVPKTGGADKIFVEID